MKIQESDTGAGDFKRTTFAHYTQHGFDIEILQDRVAKERFRLNITIKKMQNRIGGESDANNRQIESANISVMSVGHFEGLEIELVKTDSRKVQKSKITKQ